MPRHVFFYLPRHVWPAADLPETVDADPSIYFLRTDLNWVLQTYLHLKAAGHPVVLTPDFPADGVIVTFSGLMPPDLVPGPRQFLVAASGDNAPHSYAQLNVVQNRTQAAWLADSVHIPHWPQPGLVARGADRGPRFTRAAFFGDPVNLASELVAPEWRRRLADLGIDWIVRDAQSPQRADYSDVDVVLGVRSFDRHGFIRKPASKLYNAWIAGVPAVLGVECAFREERRTDLDFLEAATLAHAFDAVRRLRASAELRRQMVANGRQRAEEVTVPRLTARWWRFLSEQAFPRYEAWCRQSRRAAKHYLRGRAVQKKLRGLAHRTFRMLGKEHNAL